MLVALLASCCSAFGGIVARLAMLQVAGSPSAQALGLDQRVRTSDAARRRGRRSSTAGACRSRITLEARDIYANPALVTDPVGEAALIAEVLGVRRRTCCPALEAEGTFVYVARQVDLDVAQRVEDLHLPGIGFLPVQKRYYPAGRSPRR